jgi:hypothetical protein
VKRTVFLLGAAAMFAASSAFADDVSADLACKFRHPVKEVDSLGKVPPPIAAFIRSKTGEMAERGEYFNATDVIEKPAPMHRFIRAGESSGLWFVWFEHGGIAYSKNIAVLALKSGERAPHLIAHIGYFNENPCSLTDAVLDGHAPRPGAQSDWW